VQCVDPERASKHPDAGGYALDRFRTTRSGAREGAPLLYPVACWRDDNSMSEWVTDESLPIETG
jgi:hypothetical protein